MTADEILQLAVDANLVARGGNGEHFPAWDSESDVTPLVLDFARRVLESFDLHLEQIVSPPVVICSNCDTALPRGCDGVFSHEKHCRHASRGKR